MSLIIKNLTVSVNGKEILKGVDLEVKRGQFHVIMGPDGSGKSTLAKVLAGSPEFIVQSGKMRFNGNDLDKLTPDKRAKLGIFLGFQHPVEIPGVSVFSFLRKAKQVTRKLGDWETGKKKNPSNRVAEQPSNLSKFRENLLEYASSLKLSGDFLRRSLNEGFSGGEKKRSEILQMLALKPKLVILDEIDSGLDVDGLKIVAMAIKKFTIDNPRSSIVLITHYARILKYLKPDFVHVMVEGNIVKSGGLKLAKEIEEKGYQLLNAKRLTTKAKDSSRQARTIG